MKEYKSIFADGPTPVLTAIREEVEWIFGDWPEGQGISSSDVSCAVLNVFKTMEVDIHQAPQLEVDMVRTGVNNIMSEIL